MEKESKLAQSHLSVSFLNIVSENEKTNEN